MQRAQWDYQDGRTQEEKGRKMFNCEILWRLKAWKIKLICMFDGKAFIVDFIQPVTIFFPNKLHLKH